MLVPSLVLNWNADILSSARPKISTWSHQVHWFFSSCFHLHGLCITLSDLSHVVPIFHTLFYVCILLAEKQDSVPRAFARVYWFCVCTIRDFAFLIDFCATCTSSCQLKQFLFFSRWRASIILSYIWIYTMSVRLLNNSELRTMTYIFALPTTRNWSWARGVSPS